MFCVAQKKNTTLSVKRFVLYVHSKIQNIIFRNKINHVSEFFQVSDFATVPFTSIPLSPHHSSQTEAQSSKHPSKTAPRDSGDHPPPHTTYGGGATPKQNPVQTERTHHHHNHNWYPAAPSSQISPCNPDERSHVGSMSELGCQSTLAQPHPNVPSPHDLARHDAPRDAPRLAPTIFAAEPRLAASARVHPLVPRVNANSASHCGS